MRLITVTYVCVTCFNVHVGAMYDAEYWLFGVNQQHHASLIDATCWHHVKR